MAQLGGGGESSEDLCAGCSRHLDQRGSHTRTRVRRHAHARARVDKRTDAAELRPPVSAHICARVSAGSQFLFGFQVAHSALSGGMAGVGLTAGVGQDIPESCLAQLHNLGCDTQGLITYQRPTPRAWQVFEADGRRTQVGLLAVHV